ncbi:MAG: DNA polymerase III subunit beta [Bdellovibrionales bacterium]|nr:DNA polymerase III subunit beta [Bdellovibrionales bacterium]
MNIIISKSELNRALSMTQSVVERKTTMPILVNVLLSASDNALKISATDLEVTAVVTAGGTVKSTGSTTVNARVLNDIVRELPDGDVCLKLTEGERLQITAHNSHFMMVGISSEEFPSLPGIGLEAKGKINALALREMIDKTIYAVSHDETRFNLNGVCFEMDKSDTSKLRMVATDGHRLALIQRPFPELSFDGGAIVPTKGLQELRKVLDEEGEKEVGIAVTDGFFVVESARAKLAMRLVDGEFPDYKQVIPKEAGTMATLSCDVFTQAIRRAALMVSDKGKCVKLDFSEGKLRLSSSSPELGEASEEIEIDYPGEPVSVGFNAKYLLDFANSVAESNTVRMEISGELGPTRLMEESDDSYFGIIMPMRLT